MSFARSLFLPVVLAALLGLGGCASLQPQTPAAPRAAPFEVLGRVLVSYDGRAFTANVRWRHAPDADEIWLMTPTGQALAHLHEDGTGAVITSADQTQYRASRVEALTKRALGWELPMTRLQYWVRGVPAPVIPPDAPAEIGERDTAGRIRQLMQDGWRISYEHYPLTQNDGLPRRLELVGAAQTLRLVIDTWRGEDDKPAEASAAPAMR
jgi:outer membrane lipoprotein LolB